MKSGLGNRNNPSATRFRSCRPVVSMKSGLRDRNNYKETELPTRID